MTDTTTPVPTPTSDGTPLDLGHPVRSFVVVLLLLGVALLGIRWSAMFNPDLTVSSASAGETADGRGHHMLLVQNNGLAPLEIEAVHWPAEGWTDVNVGVLPAGIGYEGPHPAPTTTGITAFEPFTLHGGADGARWIILTGVPPCPGRPVPGNVDLRVRTWAGVERIVALPDPLGGAASEDAGCG